jgi:hypothetical protein
MRRRDFIMLTGGAAVSRRRVELLREALQASMSDPNRGCVRILEAMQLGGLRHLSKNTVRTKRIPCCSEKIPCSREFFPCYFA